MSLRGRGSDFLLVGGCSVGDLVSLVEDQEVKGEKVKLHPNGFLQLDLSSSGRWRAPGLRFHVWSDRISLPQDQEKFSVHDHIFVIDSYVLCGSLENTTYEVVGDSSGSYVLLNAGVDGLESTGERVSCIPATSEVIVHGSRYRIPKGQFHASSPCDSLVATLIHKSDTDFSSLPKVVAPLNYRAEDLVSDRSVDQSLAWELVGRAKENILRMYQ